MNEKRSFRYIKTEDSIVFNCEGKTLHISKNDPRYAVVDQAIKEESEEKIQSVMECINRDIIKTTLKF